jgi:hypothetical protein
LLSSFEQNTKNFELSSGCCEAILDDQTHASLAEFLVRSAMENREYLHEKLSSRFLLRICSIFVFSNLCFLVWN